MHEKDISANIFEKDGKRIKIINKLRGYISEYIIVNLLALSYADNANFYPRTSNMCGVYKECITYAAYC